MNKFLSTRSRLRMSWFVISVFTTALFIAIFKEQQTIAVTCGSGILTVAMAYIFGDTYRPSGTIRQTYKAMRSEAD